MKNEIYSYIRNDNGKRLGLFYAEQNTSHEINIGYSLVNYDKGDKFDLSMCIGEARKKIPVSHSDIPKHLLRYYVLFLRRCTQYFKKSKINIGTVAVKDLTIC